ncbi:ImmA/IrrE family metallo-endopeptidase [Parageobacillus toebii]|uniref:ImmA/IrrE family metallo-endopeptidase n=1 Tax=Anoxybacillaceae TaxID=3120669 RepID=UPI002570E04A|nr:ImmA/IrrE family metallo-endopeptidase [Geobacillus sp. E263]
MIDTPPNHTKRAFFIQVPEKTSNRNAPFLRANTLFSVDKIEIEANTFAIELLLPDDVIIQYQGTDLTIYDVAKMYSVPQELVHLKNFNHETERIFV